MLIEGLEGGLTLTMLSASREQFRQLAECILELVQEGESSETVQMTMGFRDGDTAAQLGQKLVWYSELSHKNCEIWECETCNPIVGKCDGCDQEFRQVEEVKSPVSACKTCDRRLCVDCDCGHDNWF